MTKSQQSASSKFPLLLLAGLIILGALVLIGLGVILFVRNSVTSGADTTPPPPLITKTLTPVPATATTVAGVVVISTPTPPPTQAALENTATPKAQTADTVGRRPTATRKPTNTPTPTTVVRQQKKETVEVDGTIELVGPQDDIQIANDTVEFKWRWLENKGCEQPPDGFAFEIRVWRDNDAVGPMGAMDAQLQKSNVSCDPDTGIRALTISRVQSVPGAEGLSSGRLRWDVALVQLDPYEPVINSQYRTFFY